MEGIDDGQTGHHFTSGSLQEVLTRFSKLSHLMIYRTCITRSMRLTLQNSLKSQMKKSENSLKAPILKRIRSSYGCTQAELAKRSGVSLRSLQMYEQRNKDINKASVETLYRISKVLGCTIEDLLEK